MIGSDRAGATIVGDPAKAGGPTLVGRLMRSRVAVGVISAAPLPLWLLRRILQRDNARENRKDSWQRLRDRSEQPRYAAVRRAVERYAAEGFVLDLGCSQGILQEGLRYGRYLGIDSLSQAITRASPKSDAQTQFSCADVDAFVPDRPPDAVVLNEVLYYLPDPLRTVQRCAGYLSPGGVVIISLFHRAWPCRRLLRRLGRRFDLLETDLVSSGHLAWTIAIYRPRRSSLPTQA